MSRGPLLHCQCQCVHWLDLSKAFDRMKWNDMKWKCSDLKCAQKPTRGRLSLTYMFKCGKMTHEWHDTLRIAEQIMDRKLTTELLNIFELWFNISVTGVKWNGYVSHFFTLVVGVRQGGVLSPFFCHFYRPFSWLSQIGTVRYAEGLWRMVITLVIV